MKLIICVAISCGFASICHASPRFGDWPIRDQQTIEKAFPLIGEPLRVVVDNIQGYVHVKGISGSEARVTAHQTIRAKRDSDLAQARSEVRLNITNQPSNVSVYYDAPWRCHAETGQCHEYQQRFYSVSYDIDIEAPLTARLVISSVNGGEIRVDESSGNFEINNVNGSIMLSGMSGSGSVHTVNGPMKVRFVKSPTSACSFKSVNGGIDVWMPRDSFADLLFKTFNGEVDTDFEVTPRSLPASLTTEHRDGKFVYHGNRLNSGRIGAGGPELNFETLNGSIRLHRGE